MRAMRLDAVLEDDCDDETMLLCCIISEVLGL